MVHLYMKYVIFYSGFFNAWCFVLLCTQHSPAFEAETDTCEYIFNWLTPAACPVQVSHWPAISFEDSSPESLGWIFYFTHTCISVFEKQDKPIFCKEHTCLLLEKT